MLLLNCSDQRIRIAEETSIRSAYLQVLRCLAICCLLLLTSFGVKAQDTAAPYRVSTNPYSGYNFWLLDAPVTIGFNEPVRAAAANGDINVYNAETAEVFFTTGSNGSAVEITGNAVTITLPAMAPETTYYVTIAPDAIEDMSGNLFSGITNPELWFFTTDDGIPPFVETFKPDKGTTTTSTCFCIEMAFDEILVELSGTIELYKADGTLVETIETGIGDNRIDVYLNEVDVDFNTDFEDLQEYYVVVSKGAFGHFISKQPNEAVEAGEWTFTSKYRPHVVNLKPADDYTDARLDTLEIEFDVAVSRRIGNDANLYIREYETDSLIETINASKMKFDDEKVTVLPQVDYPVGAHVYVTADENGVFRNRSNAKEFFGLSEKGDWDFVQGASQQKPFITKWRTESAGERISIPIKGDGYYYGVDWGDGSRGTFTKGATHEYAEAGEYMVSITGTFPQVYFNNEGDKDKIIAIEQWGKMSWRSMDSAFYGCSNLELIATDAPDLSEVSSLSAMFRDATTFNGAVDHWDMAVIKDLSYMFSGATSFNQPLNSWEGHFVVDMSGMFEGAVSFNQPLYNWKTRRVENMSKLFKGATNFNGRISNWDLYTINDMSEMFKDAVSFNQPLDTWSVSGAENMNGIFERAISFDQNLATWRVSTRVSMENALDYCGLSVRNYDRTLKGWSRHYWRPDGLAVGVAGMKFCNGEPYRNDLINNDNWTFVGDTQDCEKDAFITTWETTVAKDTIVIPTTGDGYRYTVDWGDGNVEQELTRNVSHIYQEAGDYTVKITGSFPRVYFQIEGGFTYQQWQDERAAIQSIEQWGSIEWESMERAFYSCTSLVLNAIDAPDLSEVTSLESMFERGISLTGDISHWNVSNITNMKQMFRNAKLFDSDLSGWNVRNVSNMSGMFSLADAFTGDITGWNVGGAKDMSNMFKSNATFNQDISSWDVSNVETMFSMFFGAREFNQPLNKWNVSSVTDMNGMFSLANSFNQPLNQWNVSAVTTMFGMFSNAKSFSQDLNSWDVGQVTTMERMFFQAEAFNANITDWDVSQVTEAAHMFFGTSVFNQDISRWDVSNLEDMTGMFQKAGVFNQPIGNWNVSEVTSMAQLFWEASSFNQPLGDWDVSTVSHMNAMFFEAHAFNQPLGSWETTNLKEVTSMFRKAISFNQDIEDWNMSGVVGTGGMFLEALAFNQPLGLWDVSNVKGFGSMFEGAASFDQDLSEWDLKSITSMFNTFNQSGLSRKNYDKLLVSLTQKEEVASGISVGAEGLKFCEGEDARNLLIQEYGWVFTGDSKDCEGSESFITTWRTRSGNEAITIPTKGTGYDYTIDWGDGTVDNNQTADATHTYGEAGTHTVTIIGDFPRIFVNNGEDKDKIITIQQWGDVRWESMEGAFYGASNLTNNAVDSPDLSGASSLSQMFKDCVLFNGKIRRWNISHITAMNATFSGAESFNRSLSDWDVSSVSEMTDVFSNTGLSMANYDNTVIGWGARSTLQNDVVVGAEGLGYCESQAARNALISQYNWSFQGDEEQCPDLLAPEFTSGTEIEIVENSTGVAYTMTATDEDSDIETIRFSLGNENDEALFDINDNKVSFKEAPDYENPLDAEEENVYYIEAIATDGTNTSMQVVKITILDENDEAPYFVSTTEKNYQENGEYVAYTISAVDKDSPYDLSFSLGTEHDENLFSIDKKSVSFITPPDFENPTDANGDNAYEVELIVTDGKFEVKMMVTITVTNYDETEPVVTSPLAVDFAEHGTEIAYTLTVTDEEGENIDIVLIQTPDVYNFEMRNDGEITFRSPPDFENPLDSDQDNNYEITMLVRDGTYDVYVDIVITVTDVEETPPVISSASSVSYEEHTTGVVFIASATGTQSGLTFSLGRDNDESHFRLSDNEVFFIESPDYENPGDKDGNNQYIVELVANNVAGNQSKMIVVTVININDVAPRIVSDITVEFAEDQTEPAYTVLVTDVDSESFTYQMISDYDADLFEIDGARISFKTPPDFEMPNDNNEDNVYILEISVSDGLYSDTKLIAIRVTDAEELVTSIDDDFFVTTDILVYPIPARNTLTLQPPVSQLKQYDFRIVNAQGKPMINGVVAGESKLVDVSRLPNGIYFLLITDGNHSGTKKVLIRR